jgi:uncharacterized protein YcbX
VPLAEAALTRRGLAHDRRWAVATTSGRILTQREVPALARLHAWLEPDGGVGLIVEGRRLMVPAPGTGEPFRVRVGNDDVEAEAYATPIDTALEALLGRPARLVHFPETAHRASDPHVAADAETAFADGFALLVTNEASLVWLDERLFELGGFPVPMSRFRPNIVLTEAAPFAEDEHDRLALADGTALDLVKPCERCLVTTIDQETGTPDGDQPLAALRRLRFHPILKKPVFGQNAVPRLAAGVTSTLRVGDPVTLLGSART